jgi:hypothetical protein
MGASSGGATGSGTADMGGEASMGASSAGATGSGNASMGASSGGAAASGSMGASAGGTTGSSGVMDQGNPHAAQPMHGAQGGSGATGTMGQGGPAGSGKHKPQKFAMVDSGEQYNKAFTRCMTSRGYMVENVKPGGTP